jgi:YHS domain-containing protein
LESKQGFIVMANEHTNTKPDAEKAPKWKLDVVCGMDVDPRTTPYHHVYMGREYRFCNKSCLEHFIGNPEHYLIMEQHHMDARNRRHTLQ